MQPVKHVVTHERLHTDGDWINIVEQVCIAQGVIVGDDRNRTKLPTSWR